MKLQLSLVLPTSRRKQILRLAGSGAPPVRKTCGQIGQLTPEGYPPQLNTRSAPPAFAHSTSRRGERTSPPSAGWVFGARFSDRLGKGIRGAPRDALVADLTPQPGAAYAFFAEPIGEPRGQIQLGLGGEVRIRAGMCCGRMPAVHFWYSTEADSPLG